MAGRYCSRCRKHTEEGLFQEPVAICMVCYSYEPANRDISNNLAELKYRAANSVNAKARRRREGAHYDKAARREGLLTQQQRGTRDIVTAPDDDFVMVRCDECGFDVDKPHMKFHKEHQCNDPTWREAQRDIPNSDEEEEAAYNQLTGPSQIERITGNPIDPLGILAKAKGKK